MARAAIGAFTRFSVRGYNPLFTIERHSIWETATVTIELKRQQVSTTAQTVTIGKHSFTVDMSVVEGGADEGPSPHDLYDAALGACKALTLLWYANKKGIPVADVQTRIVRDNSAERTGIYRLDATVQVGGNLTDEQLQELTGVLEKCPVHKPTTTVTTEITSTVERLP
jgi:putative redox protein